MECSTCASFRSSAQLIQPNRSFSLGCSPFPSTLRLSRFKRSFQNQLLVCNSSGSDEFGAVNGFSVTPNKLFMQEAIGAEYGEGFETFRPDGPLKVDVDFLNERLQEGLLDRIRYAMKPDEAYGLIFSWDNVMADTHGVKLKAWKQLASEEGKNIPEDDDSQTFLLYEGVDQVLNKYFTWDDAEEEIDRLKLRFSQLYYNNFLKIESPIEGLKEWLDVVYTARIPCAVVSNLDRKSMVETLERMGLQKYFQCGVAKLPFQSMLLESSMCGNGRFAVPPEEAIVTEEDGMESIAHRFLSAAIKLDRKPSKCVVFEDDPRGVTAAHNCTMMAVAIIGAHPAYELRQADLAVGNFNELSVINLRRLFANKGSSFMDPQKHTPEKPPSKRKLTVDTIF